MDATKVLRRLNQKHPHRAVTHLEFREACREIAREDGEPWPTDLASNARWVIKAEIPEPKAKVRKGRVVVVDVSKMR